MIRIRIRRSWRPTALLLLPLLAASVHSSAGERAPDGQTGACLDAAQLSALRAEVGEANASALADALADNGLEPLQLDHTIVPVRSGHGPGDVVYEPWILVPDQGDASVLAGAAATYDCSIQRPSALDPDDFVIDPEGKVFRLVPAAGQPETRTAAVCGCAPPWGGRGTPCGAWMPGRDQILYTLPAGATFAGTFELPHPEIQIRLTYTASGDECPRRDPPP